MIRRVFRIVDSWSTRLLLALFTVFACPCALRSSYLCHILPTAWVIIFQSPLNRSMPQPLVIWLLLLLASAAARTAAGADCGCDLALGSYYISREQNLSYISSLFGINDYHTLAPYNTGYPSLDYIQVGSRVNVYFACRCLALPFAPFSTYLAGSFPYRVSPQGETYASVVAKFHDLTTTTLLQPAPSSVNDVLDAGTVVNVTVTCSCANSDVSPDYRLLLTYPLGDGETPDSVAASHGLSSQAEVDLFRRYNPRADSVKEGDVVYIPLKDGYYNGIITPSTGRRKIKKVIIISVVAGTSGLFGAGIILVLFLLWYNKYYGMLPWQNWSRNAPRIESFLQKQETSHPKRYSYQDVRRMTKSFVHKLGQGGYGAVYRGNLADGREIAVKTLKDTEGDGEDFMNEVASISKTSHVNIVTLLGFCLQGRKRALIYEYMPNGSLDRYTFGNNNSAEGDNSLCWDKLFDIVIGIARGLEYLHNGCNTRIVHFDIKPQNILLDQNFCPKISDFGLAKLCQQKQSKISMVGMRGTIGYIAPEVFNRSYGAVSNKSDVYSYGMMVLEMVGARKQIDVGIDTSSNYFPQWLYDKLDQFCGATISEVGSDTTELVRKMVIVGLWCIQLRPIDRPSMSKVLEMLESNTLDLQLPPKAFWTG